MTTMSTKQWVAESITGTASSTAPAMNGTALDAVIAWAVTDLRKRARATTPEPTQYQGWEGDEGSFLVERTYTVTVPEYQLTVNTTALFDQKILYAVTATGTPVLSYTERILDEEPNED